MSRTHSMELQHKNFGLDVSSAEARSLLLRKLFMEMVGTFILVVVIEMAGDHNAIGFILTAIVYAGGPLSGGHYNPAVSFAVFLRGKLPPLELVLYVIVQLIGACGAGGLTHYVDAQYVVPGPPDGVSSGHAMATEAFFTSALAFTVLCTATTDGQAGNSFFGLAIGFVLNEGIVSASSYSGGVLNPAVSSGLHFAHGTTEDLWIYWAGPLLGSVIAATLFVFVAPGEIFENYGPLAGFHNSGMSKYAAEFIGAGYLTCGASLSGGITGFMLLAMVYSLGWISGAHVNPAVTLGAFIRGIMPAKDLVAYWAAQFMGGVLGGGIGRAIADEKADLHVAHAGKAFLMEAIFAFVLVKVVLAVASDARAGNQYFGVAIGFVVYSGAYAVSEQAISIGAFNPAVGLGLMLFAKGTSQVWIYLVAPLVGGLLASLFDRVVHPLAYADEAEKSNLRDGLLGEYA